MPDGFADSVVTDPPYGIRFMGKAWDGADIETRYATQSAGGRGRKRNGVAMQAGRNDRSAEASRVFQSWTEEWASQVLRVLKPGAYLLCFAAPRTYHRMVCGVEDAGFEIRDQIMWVYGSGFPKSHNGEWGGTALKPAHEPILAARKPLVGTVEENWRAHGTGALNIDGCRVPTSENLNGGAYAEQGGRSESQSLHTGSGMNVAGKTTGRKFAQRQGRWPANLLLDGSDEVLDVFPQAPGQMADAKTSGPRKFGNVYSPMRYGRVGEPSANSENEGVVGFKMKPGARRFDGGSAARFFYCAKASKSDRGDGNNHPTVKPAALMRYLCRLVTPAGGVVLDPFAGSGTTGKAAGLEGFSFVGIEREAAHAELAASRAGADLLTDQDAWLV